MLFQIMRAPQFFFGKFRKNYAWNICIYMVNYLDGFQENFFPIISYDRDQNSSPLSPEQVKTLRVKPNYFSPHYYVR